MEKSIADKHIWNEGYQKKKDIFFRLGRTRQNAAFREIVKYVDKIVKSYFARPSQMRILELGGGNSDWLSYFGEKYHCELWAVDYSEKGCELLWQRLKRKQLSCKIINKDFYDLNPSDIDKPIDILFSVGLLEHFSNRREIYELALRYLAKGGFFVAVVPNLNKLNLRWCLIVNPSLMNWHLRLRMSDIIRELRSHGFQDVQGAHIGGLRLFADSENLFFSITKKSVNLAGEVISRIKDISSEKISPHFVVSGRRDYEFHR